MPGRNKLLVEVAGKPVLLWTLEHLLASQVQQVVVVTGAAHLEMQQMVDSLPVGIVHNPDFQEGIGASIRAGVNAVAERAAGVFILLADQPTLQTGTINRFVEIFRAGEHRIVAAEYGEVVGNPALFHRNFFPELLALDGHEGARRVIQARSDETVSVPFPGGAFDMDTPENYARLSAMTGGPRTGVEAASSGGRRFKSCRPDLATKWPCGPGRDRRAICLRESPAT